MMSLEVVRSWPGVRNGQVINVPLPRGRRLMALGVARPPVKKRVKKTQPAPPAEELFQ